MQRQQPIFTEIPRWLNVYHPGRITVNNPEFHYYVSPSHQNQAVTLYVPDQEQYHPIKMFFNIERQQERPEQLLKDDSQIKDFSYLQSEVVEEHNRINLTSDAVTRDSSWVKKYEPVSFFDLLTDEKHNREVLEWMKSWDPIVFHRAVRKLETTPSLFNKAAVKSNYSRPAEGYNFKKLILLAGPPGCGKTTLARVLARKCGYHYEEINASDDRSGKTLISKIDNLVSNRTIRKQQKPVCVIIDEVDGALDSDSNGLHDVLRYLQTGEVGEIKKEQTDKKTAKNGAEQKKQANPQQSKYSRYSKDKFPKYNNHTSGTEVKEEERRTKIDRPVLFICNDPFVKGLRELRSKATVMYFSTLQQQRVVKRLKEISRAEKQEIQTEVLTKICQMCNCDVRSSVGLLELVVRLKRQQNISAKDLISKMRFSFIKDVNSTTNEFLAKVMHTPNKLAGESDMFKNYLNVLRQQGNSNLIAATFHHNILSYKQIFGKMSYTTRLYRQMVEADVANRQSFAFHNELDDFAVFPFAYYRINFKAEEHHRKPEFPFVFFQSNSKQKTNASLVQKILKGFPASFLPFINARRLLQDYLYVFWLTMQTSSTREEDVLKCVYKMLTYGVKLGNRFSPYVFVPEFDQLLTFGLSKPEVALCNTSRSLMQENYQFLKLKNQLVGHALIDNSKQNLENVINQLKRNRKRKRDSLHGIVKYKYLQGTGTEIKYDLKISYFFEEQKQD